MEEIDLVGKKEPVGADALDHAREFFVQSPEGFKGAFVCERLTRTGNPDDLDVIELLHHLPDHINCRVRVEDLCRDPRAALIYAVKIPDAIVALDVAPGSNRKMASPECVAGLL